MPLALVGLTVSSAVLSSLQLDWIPLTQEHQTALVLMAFAFPLQAVASVLLFLARDAPAGAGIGVLAFSWLTLGLLLFMSPPGGTGAVLSVFLFAAGAALLPGIASTFVSKIVPAGILLLACAKLVLTGVYEKVGTTSWEHAAGWEGLVLAGASIYAALASDFESELHRTVLPLGRWGIGRRAIDHDIDAQSHALEREPGVRPQV